jgi:hypothetical protein
MAIYPNSDIQQFLYGPYFYFRVEAREKQSKVIITAAWHFLEV